MIPVKLDEFLEADINCPSCGEPLTENRLTCQNCGIDLAVAALIAEQQAMMPIRLTEGAPWSPELLVPRIGDYLIERGMVQAEQLQNALEYQKSLSLEGKSVLLGQAMLELGMVSREILDEVVTAQILELQTALSRTNRLLKQRVDEQTHELRYALERISELNQLKTNFVANISHELRTPLTHIKGYLDILADGGLGRLNEDQSAAIEVIKKAEDRLEQLIEDLIQFSMAARGDISLTRKPVYPGRLVEEVIERSKNKAKKQGIKLEAEIPVDLPLIYIDEDKILWVLLQLLDNAVKFTPKGGEVKIKINSKDHEQVHFIISDTGIGIPEDRIPEIFEPFHQLDGTTTRRYSGTGLGLAMARKIIEAHGTSIRVKSVEGMGSTMEFELPTNSFAA